MDMYNKNNQQPMQQQGYVVPKYTEQHRLQIINSRSKDIMLLILINTIPYIALRLVFDNPESWLKFGKPFFKLLLWPQGIYSLVILLYIMIKSFKIATLSGGKH